MPDSRTLFENVRLRPGMYVQEPTYAVLSAFVRGYDLALDGGPLCGFREWLVARLGYANNLAWEGLVLEAAFPDAPNPQAEVRSSTANQQHAVRVMFELIAEFQTLRAESDGMRKIYAQYERWVNKQSWYTPDSPQWIGGETKRTGLKSRRSR